MVKNLDPHLTEAQLFEHFSRYGPIRSMRLLTQFDNAAGRPACSNMAFVAFDTPEQAQEVVKVADGTWVGNRCIIAQSWVRRSPNPKNEYGLVKGEPKCA